MAKNKSSGEDNPGKKASKKASKKAGKKKEAAAEINGEQSIFEDMPAEDAQVETAEEEAPKELTLEGLVEQLVLAAEKVEEYKEQALRAEAEMQNVRRRTARDVENAHKFGTERLLQSLLPVVDSLDKAIESAHEDEEANRAIIEGLEICLKMLTDVLDREKVVQLNPEGEPFDPKFHEAIQIVERDDMEPNSVAMVIQKGYTLNERLVRPAMVIVSKESKSSEPADETTAED